MKRILDIVSDYWKGFTALISIISIISVTAVKIDRKKYREEIRIQEEINLNQDLSQLSLKVDDLCKSINDINLSLIEISNDIEDERKEREVLQRSYIEYVRKNTRSTEELYNVFKDFIDEEKNRVDNY